MDFLEKAKIRLEHWIDHSDHHIEEYIGFADQLEQTGRSESANHVREMIKLNQESSKCLKKALSALK